jgi:hypothetical protein
LKERNNRSVKDNIKEKVHMENASTDAGIVTSPTPFADVNAVLYDFAVRIRAILGSHLRGMYLYGSLALGDFDPHSSDIDFIVMTDTDLANDLIAALQEMHERFEESSSPWAGKVEAAYIPQEALKRLTPGPERYPQVEKGTSLFKAPLEIGWVFQCYTLREHGVRIVGPDPHQLLNPIDPSNLRRAVPAIPTMWLEQVRNDPSWLDWVRQRENQAFVVLTLCRLLHVLDKATVVSKPAAARWAQKALDIRWTDLIERSLAGQHEQAETPESDVQDTLALLQYTVQGSQEG